ncbi:MAG: hypothetical protein ACXVPU_04410 [Bacteroidia bacterium]
MKKILPPVLLAIFLFNVAGYFIVFKIEQSQVKDEIESEIKAGVNTEDLTIITINKTDLSSIQWTESNKEMRYKDALYDVVKSCDSEKTITYYCINDTKEESLFASLDNHINTHVVANKTDKNSKKSVENFVKLYFPSKQKAEAIAVINVSANHLPFHLIFTSAIIEKNAPPPELV